MAAQAPSLPDDVVAEILVRLPARSIGRSRAVCRAWNAIASHPSVDRVLATRPPAVATVTGGDPERSHAAAAVRLDLFRGRWHRADVHKTAPCPRGLSLGDMKLSADAFCSWDGVLCTRTSRAPGAGAGDHVVLWNPLTDACAVVPFPAGRSGWVIGGYVHPATGRFHLLHASGVSVTAPGDGGRGLVSLVSARILRVGDGTDWREVPLPAGCSKMLLRIPGDHCAGSHGNLHWLVQPEGAGTATLLVFDTAREAFRLMAAPPERRGRLDLTTARCRALPGPGGGKLCVLALTESGKPAAALKVWVLEGYSDPARGWRLREEVRMVRLDGTDLSPRFAAAGATVEVVEGAREGEEILVRLDDRIDAYSVRGKAWRRVSVSRRYRLLMCRESVLPPETSFGKALRGFYRGRARAAPTSSLDSHFWFRHDPTVELEWSFTERVLDS